MTFERILLKIKRLLDRHSQTTINLNPVIIKPIKITFTNPLQKNSHFQDIDIILLKKYYDEWSVQLSNENLDKNSALDKLTQIILNHTSKAALFNELEAILEISECLKKCYQRVKLLQPINDFAKFYSYKNVIEKAYPELKSETRLIKFFKILDIHEEFFIKLQNNYNSQIIFILNFIEIDDAKGLLKILDTDIRLFNFCWRYSFRKDYDFNELGKINGFKNLIKFCLKVVNFFENNSFLSSEQKIEYKWIFLIKLETLLPLWIHNDQGTLGYMWSIKWDFWNFVVLIEDYLNLLADLERSNLSDHAIKLINQFNCVLDQDVEQYLDAKKLFNVFLIQCNSDDEISLNFKYSFFEKIINNEEINWATIGEILHECSDDNICHIILTNIVEVDSILNCINQLKGILSSEFIYKNLGQYIKIKDEINLLSAKKLLTIDNLALLDSCHEKLNSKFVAIALCFANQIKKSYLSYRIPTDEQELLNIILMLNSLTQADILIENKEEPLLKLHKKQELWTRKDYLRIVKAVLEALLNTQNILLASDWISIVLECCLAHEKDPDTFLEIIDSICFKTPDEFRKIPEDFFLTVSILIDAKKMEQIYKFLIADLQDLKTIEELRIKENKPKIYKNFFFFKLQGAPMSIKEKYMEPIGFVNFKQIPFFSLSDDKPKPKYEAYEQKFTDRVFKFLEV